MSDLITIDAGHDLPILPDQCTFCVHFIGWPVRTCKAFPDGIPEDILRGKFDHTRPHKGDHGISFKKV